MPARSLLYSSSFLNLDGTDRRELRHTDSLIWGAYMGSLDLALIRFMLFYAVELPLN